MGVERETKTVVTLDMIIRDQQYYDYKLNRFQNNIQRMTLKAILWIDNGN